MTMADVVTSAGSISQPARSFENLFDDLEATELAFSAPLTTPISECFRWTSLPTTVLGNGEQTSSQLEDYLAKPWSKHLLSRNAFYVVVFRSIRGVSADDGLLYKADADAQAEARAGAGLLKYWYGTLNERRECLAMCIWDGQESALAAVHKPKHRIALQLASQMYDIYTLERYWLTVSDSANQELLELSASQATSSQLTSITKAAISRRVAIPSGMAFHFNLIRSTPVTINPGALHRGLIPPLSTVSS
eukprot:TRINITY_DN19214_c0_g1_i1.p1 TRINITY_DN19214_c0_g1~~TRINITY_DN19214_c0_g1_i1.p1  ORF type:complete len:249 (+),score=23.08 TRINITY_DN19214_c0_g1_i1:274-1020(+)